MLLAHYGLPIVGVIIFAGEIGLPTLVPGEVGLLLAGNQYISSVWALLLAIAVFGTIDLIATSTIHVAARTGGNSLLRRVLAHISRRRTPEESIARYRLRLGRRDSLVVFCTRLIPMFRLYASIATGLIKVDFRKFLTGAAPAAWLWASIPLTVGFLLRSEIGPVISRYSSVMQWAIPVSVVATALAIATIWLHGRRVEAIPLTPAQPRRPR